MWAMTNVAPLCLVSPDPNASKCASQRGATTTQARPALKIRNWTEIRAQGSRKLGAKDCIVRCGVRTHALSREPELKSGALDHSAKLTIPMLVAGMEEIRFVRHAETRDLKCLLC